MTILEQWFEYRSWRSRAEIAEARVRQLEEYIDLLTRAGEHPPTNDKKKPEQKQSAKGTINGI